LASTSTARHLAIVLCCAWLSGCPQDSPDSGSFGAGGFGVDVGPDTAHDAGSTASDATTAADVPVDSGSAQDSGAVDSGAVDSGAADTGPADAGKVDAGCTSAAQCDDGNPCTDAVCAQGSCQFPPKSGSCTASPCTAGDQCQAGKCVAGQPTYFLRNYKEFGHVEAMGSVFAVTAGMVTTITTYDAAKQARYGWYVRTDNTGKIVKKQTYSTSYSGLYDMAFPTGGGILLGGTAYSSNYVYNGWAVRLNQAEQIAWQQVYGGKSAGAISAVATVGTDRFGFAGHITAGTTVNGWLGMASIVDGKQKWATPLGGTKTDLLVALAVMPDEGLVGVGVSENGGLGTKDVWVVRLDKEGKAKFNKYYGGAMHDEAADVMVVTGGNLLVMGTTASQGAGGFDIWASTIDPEGKLLWQKTYGGSGNEWFGAMAAHTQGLIVLGSTASKGKGAVSPWLLGLGPAMAHLWDKPLGGAETAYGRDVFIDHLGRLSLSLWEQGGGNATTAMLGRADPWGNASCGTSGVCAAKPMTACDDADPCTVDSCTGVGCTHKKAPDGAYCAIGKLCFGGVCKAV